MNFHYTALFRDMDMIPLSPAREVDERTFTHKEPSMGVGPRTKLVISMAAAVAGLALLLSLLMSSQPANPAEAFLAVLLLIGGALALWSRTKSKPSEKPADGPILDRTEAIEPSSESEPDDFLAQFRKSNEIDEVAKAETEDAAKKSEADEFLAQFLKK